jgi:hypothetical protein
MYLAVRSGIIMDEMIQKCIEGQEEGLLWATVDFRSTPLKAVLSQASVVYLP